MDNREIDAQVAEKILGWQIGQNGPNKWTVSVDGKILFDIPRIQQGIDPVTGRPHYKPWWLSTDKLPKFCTDPAEAQRALEHAAGNMGFSFNVKHDHATGTWVCTVKFADGSLSHGRAQTEAMSILEAACEKRGIEL